MKKLILATAFLFCALSISAQSFVKPEQITSAFLANHFTEKGYKILETKDGFVKIADQDDYVLYLDIDKDKKYLFINVANNFIPTASEAKIDLLIKEINKLPMIKVQLFEKPTKTIEYQYYFWISNGFNLETLDDAVSEFYLYQGDALNLDKEKLIK